MESKKEFLQGYRKAIYFFLGIVLLGFMIWLKPESTVSEIMTAYTWLGSTFIAGTLFNKGIQKLPLPKDTKEL